MQMFGLITLIWSKPALFELWWELSFHKNILVCAIAMHISISAYGVLWRIEDTPRWRVYWFDSGDLWWWWIRWWWCDHSLNNRDENEEPIEVFYEWYFMINAMIPANRSKKELPRWTGDFSNTNTNTNTNTNINTKGKNPTSLEQESFPPECCSLEAVDIPSNTLSLGCNTWILDSRIRNYRKERSEIPTRNRAKTETTKS